MELSKSSIYSMPDVADHVEMGGSIDFNEFYTIEVDECNEEVSSRSQAWLLSFDAEEVWIPKSQVDYEAGDDTIDIKGWLLDKIVREYFV